MIFGSRIEVLLTPWGWRLHSLHRLPQLPEMAVVVLRGRGAAEDTVPVKIQEVAKRQEDYFVETLEIQQHNFFFSNHTQLLKIIFVKYNNDPVPFYRVG